MYLVQGVFLNRYYILCWAMSYDDDGANDLVLSLSFLIFETVRMRRLNQCFLFLANFHWLAYSFLVHPIGEPTVVQLVCVAFFPSLGNQTAGLVEKPHAWFPSLESCSSCDHSQLDLCSILRIYQIKSIWVYVDCLCLTTKLLPQSVDPTGNSNLMIPLISRL